MKTRFNERALALLALVFLIAIITVYTVKKLNASEITTQRDKNTAAALNEAKDALMRWSIAHQQYPGILPFPNRSAVNPYDDLVTWVSTNILINRMLIAGRLS